MLLRILTIILLVSILLVSLPSHADAGGSGITPVKRRIVRAPVVRMVRTWR